ncbi:TPA: hypothetical protein HA244_00995 [Candidatus Micrarchaeota archaeon]|nr:hypothetical protein [Candidatus Micrarchaeota archaeon]
METVSYPLRIPEEILALAKLRAKEEYLDQSTALRQMLYLGAEDYVLSLVETGRISVGRAAELLKTSVQDIHRLAEKHGMRIGATGEQQKKSRLTLNRLSRK